MGVVTPIKVTNPSKWRTKYGKKGICNFDMNYNFYFKWLLNKIASCFIIRGGDDTKVNKNYLKLNLILNGGICITDFNDELYACVGNLGGEPDEYYVPTRFIIANPILGSKTVRWRDFRDEKKNGVLITNTDIDLFVQDVLDCGLFTLIHQTATLLADNIVSINSCQINTRVVNFFTADSKSQRLEGEAVLQEMYAGVPYKILRSDLVNKLQVCPTSNSSVSQNLTELVELNNYIIANFLHSIGVTANGVMKREIIIGKEIDSQNEMVNLSLTEMLGSWTKGFDEANDFYGTDFEVLLNPVIVNQLVSEVTSGSSGAEPVDDMPRNGDNLGTDSVVGSDTVPEGEQEEPEQLEAEPDSVPSQPETILEQAEEVVEDVADYLTGSSDETQEEGGEVDDDTKTTDAED